MWDGMGCGWTLDGRGCSNRRSTAWCLVLPDEEELSSLQCYRFWPWAIAAREEYPRRTGINEQGLRDPPGDYCLSCSINISKNVRASAI